MRAAGPDREAYVGARIEAHEETGGTHDTGGRRRGARSPCLLLEAAEDAVGVGGPGEILEVHVGQ